MAQAEQARHEMMHRVWQEEQEKLRRQKAPLESKEELKGIMAKYAECSRLENFLQYIETRLPSLDDSRRARLKVLIDQARLLFQCETTVDDFMAWRHHLSGKFLIGHELF